MKRLRTKVVASIVAVLILFCSLPMGSVTAKSLPSAGGVSITFKPNSAITYSELDEGLDFDSLVEMGEETKESFDYSVTGDKTNGYTVSFESTYSLSTFTFGVTPNNGATIESVNADYKKSNGSETTLIAQSQMGETKVYKFSFTLATTGQKFFSVSVTTSNPTYTVTAPSDQIGYTFAPKEGYNDLESDESGNFEFTIEAQQGYKKPTVTVTGEAKVETNNQVADLDSVTTYDYKITGINKNVTIRYTGGKQTYTVEFNDKTGYTFYTTNGSNAIEHGGSLTFYVVPGDGYKSITYSDIEIKKGDTSGSTASGSVTPLGSNQFLLSGVKENVKLSLRENAGGKQTYTVTTSEEQIGYTFTAEDGYTDLKSDGDGNFKFSITAETGYKEPNVRVSSGTLQKDGEPTTSEDGTKYTYTVNDINQNITITFTGGKETYNVSFDTTNGYTFAKAGNESTIEYGGVFNFYVTPKPGYKAITENNIKVKNAEGTTDASGTVISLGSNQYQLSGVTENVKITLADVGEETYSITLPSGTGYSVSVEDNQDGITKNTENVSYTSKYGKDFKFKITLSKGYTDSSIVVYANGTEEVTADTDSVGENTKQYTISNITSDQKITISGVTRNNYRVSLSSGDGYTLTTTDSTSQIPYESEFHFTLTVKDGYKADSDPIVTATVGLSETAPKVTVSKESDTVYKCTVKVTDNITGFTVSGVDAKTYKVDVKDAKGFTVNTQSGDKDNIAYNGSYSFTVSVNSGYRLVNVAVSTKGGNDLTAISPIAGTYYINNITTDKTITVEVAKVTLTVTYNDSLNTDKPETVVTYTVDGVKVNGGEDNSKYGSVAENGLVTFPTTAENEYSEYYKFDGWFNNDVKFEESTRELENADASLTLTAKWTPDWSQIFTLQWDGDANTNTIKDAKLTIKYGPDVLKNEVPILENAQITKMGVYYTNDSTALDNDIKLQALKEYFVDGGKITETKSVRQIIPNSDKSVVLYVYVTSYTDITYWQSFEQSFTGVTSDRYAVGWIELTLHDGSKQYIYTELKTITAN